MERIFNLTRESHRQQYKAVLDHIQGFGKWIESVSGTQKDKALNFIEKYFNHLNDLTKRSMFEHLLDITNTRLIDVNKQNDLMALVEQLLKLKKQIKGL